MKTLLIASAALMAGTAALSRPPFTCLSSPAAAVYIILATDGARE